MYEQLCSDVLSGSCLDPTVLYVTHLANSEDIRIRQPLIRFHQHCISPVPAHPLAPLFMTLVGLESYLSFSFLLFFFFFFFPLFLFRRSLYFVIRTYYLHYLLVPSDLIMQELYPASIKHPEEFWTKGKI